MPNTTTPESDPAQKPPGRWDSIWDYLDRPEADDLISNAGFLLLVALPLAIIGPLDVFNWIKGLYG